MFWDDYSVILNNRFIKDWAFWPQLLTQDFLAGADDISKCWRPLLSTVFAIEWHLWANWTPGWHAVTILLHIADSILLFLLIKTVFKNHWLALLTALMFLMHPAQTQTVVYPAGMGDPLASLFTFSGLFFFAQSLASKKPTPHNPNYWLALVCYPLALLSRESSIMLVAFIVLIITKEIFLPPPSTQKDWKASFLSILPFAIIASEYLLLRAIIFNFQSFNSYGPNAFTTNIGIRILVFFQTLASYAGILFVPYDLRFVRMDRPPNVLLTPETALGLLFFLILVSFAWHFRRKQPAVTFGIIWFFIALLPTSNLIVIIYAITHENFLYTALIGIWLGVFALLLDWAKNNKKKELLTAGLLILFIAFGIRVIWRNTDWRTAIGFYEKELITSPNNDRLWNNLGTEYINKGLNAKATAAFTQAISLNPMNPQAYRNLAFLEKKSGKIDLAIAHFEKAIALRPRFLLPYNPLAWLYLNKKEYAKARRVLEQKISVSSDTIPILQMLIAIAVQENAYNDTKRYLLILLEKQPGNEEAKAWLKKIDSAAPGSLKAVLVPSPEK